MKAASYGAQWEETHVSAIFADAGYRDREGNSGSERARGPTCGLCRATPLPATALRWASLVPGASAFVAGAAVGAGAALLFAPAKGEEMRKKLRDQAATLRQRAQQMMTRAQPTAEGEESTGTVAQIYSGESPDSATRVYPAS